MKKLVLLLPVLALVLQCDKLLASGPVPPAYTPDSLQEALEALPARNHGRYGKEGNALNMLFLGSEEDVRGALEHAGWTSIPLTISACVSEGLGEWWRGETVSSFPPMQGYRLMGRYQDLNWAQVVSWQARHHFRMWRTGIRDKKGRELWWASGDYDEKLRLWDLSHVPNPDLNLERQWLQDSLAGSPYVEKLTLVPLKQIPRSYRNDNRYPFTSDGRALLVELKPG